ncbi:hypothetical protein EMA8858_01809 [Emticicia aquatica]|jgi:hypothetical protein|uniref:Uncharacterized protein n=1 Tax=Emticicia aquatica TaxID=1681835 RepID=A0ABN8ES14_9BACT|nr:hypothetical protein [Emticicia aquatica]CAH0995684.1 hypothetical protein EMA8858_01809 [Emticicia aquatica]
MKRATFIFGLMFYSTFIFAQTDIYRLHSSFLPSIKHKNSEQSMKVPVLFDQNKPLFLQYISKKRDCFFLLSSQTSICFNREINMDAMSRQTKQLFFKMKMWKYFH